MPLIALVAVTGTQDDGSSLIYLNYQVSVLNSPGTPWSTGNAYPYDPTISPAENLAAWYAHIINTAASGGFTITADNIVRMEALNTTLQSGQAITAPNNTSRNVLKSVPIPVLRLGPTGRINWTANLSFTNSINAKNFDVACGGLSGTNFYSQNMASLTNTGAVLSGQILNRNSVSSQIGTLVSGVTLLGGLLTPLSATGGVNFAAGSTLDFIVQKASAGEIFKLESWTVDLIS